MGRILIDHRAGSGYLIEHPKLKDVGYLCKGREQLEHGDISFAGNGPKGPLKFGIEIKSIEDLFQSVVQGRLQGHGGQLEGMLEVYDVVYVLYYGHMRPAKDAYLYTDLRQESKSWRRNGRPYAFLNSFLMGLDDLGVRYAHCHDKSTTGDWIRACFNRYQKSWDKHRTMKVFNQSGAIKIVDDSLQGGLIERLDQKIDAAKLQRMRFAATISGISYTIAEEVADHFTTTYLMVQASEKEWSKVKGVGKAIAETAVRELRARSE